MRIGLLNLIPRTAYNRRAIPHISSNRDAMIVQLARSLQDQGHDVVVFLSDSYRPDKSDERVEVQYLPTKLKRIFLPTRLPFTPSLYNHLLKKPFDLLITTEIFQLASLMATRAGLKSKAKVVVWEEQAEHQSLLWSWPSRIFHRVTRKYYEKTVDWFIPRSPRAQKFLLEIGITKNRVTDVVPHGIDETIFKPQNNNGGTQRKKPYILCVSILIAVKRLDVLINAYSKIADEFPDLQLIIKGNGPLEKELRGLASDLGLHNRIVFDTKRSNHQEMAQLYADAELFAYCGRHGGMPFSPIESIACGTPVVISDWTEISDIFLDGKGGLVTSGGNVSELVKELRNLMHNDALRHKLSKEALEKSAAFSNSSIARELITVSMRNSYKNDHHK